MMVMMTMMVVTTVTIFYYCYHYHNYSNSIIGKFVVITVINIAVSLTLLL